MTTSSETGPPASTAVLRDRAPSSATRAVIPSVLRRGGAVRNWAIELCDVLEIAPVPCIEVLVRRGCLASSRDEDVPASDAPPRLRRGSSGSAVKHRRGVRVTCVLHPLAEGPPSPGAAVASQQRRGYALRALGPIVPERHGVPSLLPARRSRSSGSAGRAGVVVGCARVENHGLQHALHSEPAGNGVDHGALPSSGVLLGWTSIRLPCHLLRITCFRDSVPV
ncbi:hypothetical protein HPB49_002629 [Dermacentor silvarum]|uniref:Uncharacterized protein n=1 Tax=Dermacentor silvarum TaxID=543639 RepID=A0ACB8D2I0_DERSI|nr:hypothetical protein HPB49_002629 [Dermacentor silvarum]